MLISPYVNLFWVDVLQPSQQFFSHVSLCQDISWVELLRSSENKGSCSRTQCVCWCLNQGPPDLKSSTLPLLFWLSNKHGIVSYSTWNSWNIDTQNCNDFLFCFVVRMIFIPYHGFLCIKFDFKRPCVFIKISNMLIKCPSEWLCPKGWHLFIVMISLGQI